MNNTDFTIYVIVTALITVIAFGPMVRDFIRLERKR